MPDENPVDLIFAQLLANQRVVKSVLRAMCPLFSDQEFGLALHAAQERIRDEHQIVFVPTPGRAGVLVRATAAQKINRGQQFARTAVRKHQRSVAIVESVNPEELPQDSQTLLQGTIEKLRNAALRSEQAMSMRTPAPTVCEVPRVPRRGT